MTSRLTTAYTQQSSGNIGHFGAAFSCLARFASPSLLQVAPSGGTLRLSEPGADQAVSNLKKRFWNHSATPTRPIITGTSTSGPITAAKAAPELMP